MNVSSTPVSRMLVPGVALLALLAVTPLRAQDASYRLIVHSTNPVSALSRDEVTKMFLKKVPAWHGGEPVVPVDQAEETDVRKAFSKRVLGKDVAAVKGYWQQAIFTGRGFPPVEKASDADVASFVAATPNAIGYVSSAAAIPTGVKVVKVEN